MAALLSQEQVKPLLSEEHFSVDGTLFEAWANHKSFRPKDGNNNSNGRDFRGTQRKNDTHESVTYSDSHLYRKAGSATWPMR